MNPAETEYPILLALAERWSPRAFEDRPVEAEKLGALFEAARWAPSSANLQPWAFFVARREDEAAFGALASALLPGNQRWAAQAPVLLAVTHNTVMIRGDVRRTSPTSAYDVGLAMGQLGAQASAVGLHVHQMAGFDAQILRAAVGLPEDWSPVAMAAIGYLGQPEQLPPDLAQREVAPRTRKPLSEIVYTGAFGQAAPWLISRS